MANLRKASAELSSRLASQMRLTGLDQKVRGQDSELFCPRVADDAPPADRRGLTRSNTLEERGKPVVLSLTADSGPQGPPMGQRAEDGRKSEGRIVTIRIEGAFLSRTTSPHAKAG